jgi:hypothetical protein
MSKVERALKLTNAALEQMREQNRCEGIPSSLICAYSWLEEIADLLQPPADTIPVRVALAMGFDETAKLLVPLLVTAAAATRDDGQRRKNFSVT